MLVPILEFEEKVQIKDKTRLNARKSFVTKGGVALVDILIKAGASASAVSVMASDSEQWYLDWLWDQAEFDIDSTNNKIYFKRVSTGIEYEATLDDGTYNFEDLLTEIVAQLNSASAVTWVGAISTDNKYTLTPSEEVTLQAKKKPANLLPHIGFVNEKTNTDFLGEMIEYGIKKITVSMTTDSPTPGPQAFTTKDYYQKVYTVEGDALFSSDDDLTFHESDILKWVPRGRSSFMNGHRRSQDLIMRYLWQNNFCDVNGNKLTKFAIIDKEEVRLWSTYQTLQNIFLSFQNANEDVFKEKAKYYEKLMIQQRNTWTLTLDTNGDGKVDDEPKVATTSCTLVRT